MSAATLARFATSAWPISCGPRPDRGLTVQRLLRLEFVFDLLHQGKARVGSQVHHLLILPFIGVKPDERVEQALLRFAQTVDRELPSRMGRVD